MLRLRLTKPVPAGTANRTRLPQVHNGSGKAAEQSDAAKFLRTAHAEAYTRHLLATSKAVTVDMMYDEEAKAFVTFVKELHGMSTFGPTEAAALDNTAEMIRGYIKSMETNKKKIPLSAPKLKDLKNAVGIG